MFTPSYKLITEALIEMRKTAGLTQRQLAKRLGRELSFISRLEKGERRIDLLEFTWYCDACEVDPVVKGNEIFAALKARGSRPSKRR